MLVVAMELICDRVPSSWRSECNRARMGWCRVVSNQRHKVGAGSGAGEERCRYNKAEERESMTRGAESALVTWLRK